MINTIKQAYADWREDRRKHHLELVAIAIAEMAHSGQTRKRTGQLYVYHPMRVADYIRKVVSDNDLNKYNMILAAILHDTIEDSDGFVTVDTLFYNGIPQPVIDAVVLLSKNLHKGLSYYEYLDKLALNVIATTVKIADMIDNLSDHPSTKQLVKYSGGLNHLVRNSRCDKIFK